jgi:hypothetical protein
VSEFRFAYCSYRSQAMSTTGCVERLSYVENRLRTSALRAQFSGKAPQGGLAEHVGANQGALAQITQKLGTATDLSAAFARRHAELVSAIAAGRDWLGIEHDTLPDRMALIRAAAPRPLWLPPAVSTLLPTRERKLISPVPTVQGPVGQKAAVHASRDSAHRTARS